MCEDNMCGMLVVGESKKFLFFDEIKRKSNS